MTDETQDIHPSAASWIAVALAWVVVGVPLLWGIFNTFRKAAILFR